MNKVINDNAQRNLNKRHLTTQKPYLAVINDRGTEMGENLTAFYELFNKHNIRFFDVKDSFNNVVTGEVPKNFAQEEVTIYGDLTAKKLINAARNLKPLVDVPQSIIETALRQAELPVIFIGETIAKVLKHFPKTALVYKIENGNPDKTIIDHMPEITRIAATKFRALV